MLYITEHVFSSQRVLWAGSTLPLNSTSYLCAPAHSESEKKKKNPNTLIIPKRQWVTPEAFYAVADMPLIGWYQGAFSCVDWSQECGVYLVNLETVWLVLLRLHGHTGDVVSDCGPQFVKLPSKQNQSSLPEPLLPVFNMTTTPWSALPLVSRIFNVLMCIRLSFTATSGTREGGFFHVCLGLHCLLLQDMAVLSQSSVILWDALLSPLTADAHLLPPDGSVWFSTWDFPLQMVTVKVIPNLVGPFTIHMVPEEMRLHLNNHLSSQSRTIWNTITSHCLIQSC